MAFNRPFIRLVVLLAVLIPGTGSADNPEISAETVSGELDHPWSMAFLPGHSDNPGMELFLVTERSGRLLLYTGGEVRAVSGLPRIAVEGQGGLLDIVLSPDFSRDSLVYFSFAESGSGGFGTSVARGELYIPAVSGGSPELTNVDVIYRALPRSGGGRHFGSRLVFDSEGFLYVTLGERGDRNRARDSFDPYGSVLRLFSDGSVPGDNPFAAEGEEPEGGAPEVWTTGHRNAQGIAVNPETGEVWIHEHGPKGGDEVNILIPGGDYGWPLLTHGTEYSGNIITNRQSAPGFEDPLLHWTPSIAPSGMAFYTGGIYPDWQGDLFVGALAGRHLRRIILENGSPVGQEVLLQNVVGRIRDVRVSPGGYLYLLTDEASGAVYRLEPGR